METLPQGVTVQESSDGRPALFIFQLGRDRRRDAAIVLVLMALLIPAWGIFFHYDMDAMPFFLAAWSLGVALLFTSILLMNRRICLTEKGIYQDLPSNRRGIAWQDVSCLGVFRTFGTPWLSIRSIFGPRIDVKISPRGLGFGMRNRECVDLFLRLVAQFSGHVFDRKAEEVIKGEEILELPLSKMQYLLEHMRIVMVVTFICIPLCFLIPFLTMSSGSPHSGVILFVSIGVMGLGILIIPTALARSASKRKMRNFAALTADAGGLRLANEKRKYSWSEIGKIEYENAERPEEKITHLKIHLPDKSEPLIVPYHSNHFNVFLALLKQKNLLAPNA
jgi:hypothetical protein